MYDEVLLDINMETKKMVFKQYNNSVNFGIMNNKVCCVINYAQLIIKKVCSLMNLIIPFQNYISIEN